MSWCLPNNHSILPQKHSSSLSLNDLNHLECTRLQLIRLTGRAIQVMKRTKHLQNFKHQKFQLSEMALKMAQCNLQEGC